MRIKLDENLPGEIKNVLNGHGFDCDTVKDEGLLGRDDVTVWQACLDDQRILVTQDLDFSDIRRFLPGTHPGLILVRFAQPSRRRLTESIVSLVLDGEDLRGCFTVLTERKVRVHRP